MKSQYCQYSKCKAVAEFDTPMGCFCPYHYTVLKKKKGNLGKKIILTNAERKLLQMSRLNPMFIVIKRKGGKQ